MNQRISPCMGCTRVMDPMNCENKNCQVWQRWFIARWESMRRSVMEGVRDTPVRAVGVPIGGRRYTTEEQRLRYLNTDPCSGCVCDKDFCYEPCPSRKSWEMARRTP